MALEILDGLNIDEGLAPREYLIRPLIERQSIYLCTGTSNSGKSTLLQYVAHCFARGRQVGAYSVPTPGKTLWVAGEDAYNARLRVLGMLDYYGDVPTAKGLILPAAISVMDDQSMIAFHRGVEEAAGRDPELVAIFLDSKSIIWGGDDENSNSENTEFLGIVRDEICERYGAAVFLLHHLTKGSRDPNAPPQTARGASALINNADAEIRFTQSKSGRLTMAPGNKLRGRRWDPISFDNHLVTLSSTLHPTLRDDQRYMPEINIAVPLGSVRADASTPGDMPWWSRFIAEERASVCFALEHFKRVAKNVPKANQGQRTAFHVLRGYPDLLCDSPGVCEGYINELLEGGELQVVSRRNPVNRHSGRYLELTEKGLALCAQYRHELYGGQTVAEGGAPN
jgi:hypothetical protein